MAEEYTIRRTGDTPLRFEGEEVVRESTKYVRGRERNRWHEIAIYETVGGQWIVEISYRTQWQGETDHAEAEVLDGPGQVSRWLQAYSATAHVRGFPPTDTYRTRQERLLLDIRQDYVSLVADVLAADERFWQDVE